MAERSIAAARALRAFGLGLALGLVGSLSSLVPGVLELDESVGLRVLFFLRGPLTAPPDVAVVSISGDSAAGVGQTSELDEWRREVHAKLIDSLVAAGAAVVAFDIIFDKPRDPLEDDQLLAESIRAAGNVILAERVSEDELGRDRRVLPLPEFETGALATAPFTLPRLPIRVAQFWVFDRGERDLPSLPAVALQAYLLPHYGDFIALLRDVRPDVAAMVPRSAADIRASRDLETVMRTLRTAFRRDASLRSELGERLPSLVERSPAAGAAVARLLDLYAGPSNRYINYLGPPQTVRTVPYDRVPDDARHLDLGGKMLFVGFAEHRQIEQQDWFYSVFTQRTGAMLSGVEIGATAFANLLEGRSIRPLAMPQHLLLVLLWGFVLGTTVGLLPLGRGLGVALLAGALYFWVAYEAFVDRDLWSPLLVPLVVQLPLALAGGFFLNYRELKTQRERVQTVLGYYVPVAVVKKLAEQSVSMEANRQLVHGTCLFTDAEEYTTVSEALHPEALRALMNEYFQVMFGAVTRHGGHVSDTAGDSMVAVWTTAAPDPSSRARACRAAADILEAVAGFNANRGRQQLPTRIGLASGELLLGNVGAGQHYEYRAIGDIVNTASRLQGLSRVLGTRVLMSDATVAGAGLRTRDLGMFLLRGKTTPLRIHEPVDAADARALRDLLEPFGAALQCIERQDWADARRRFAALVDAFPGDGPSAYYLALSADYERQPPDWRGYVTVNVK